MYRLSDNPTAAAHALTDRDLIDALMVCSCALHYAHTVAYRNFRLSAWICLSACNHAWMYVHFCALIDEHKYRYGDDSQYVNAYDEYRDRLVKAPKDTSDGPETPYPIFVDEEYIIGDDVVESYRNYYRKANADPAKWTRREPPEWMHLTKS